MFLSRVESGKLIRVRSEYNLGLLKPPFEEALRNWRRRARNYTRLFSPPHRKATLISLAVVAGVSLLIRALYKVEATEGAIAFFVFAGFFVVWGRQVWITDDYDRAERAAAEAERVRQEAEQQRAAQHVPAPTPDSWYAVLGMGPNATVTEIKTAYRRAVKRFHPDRRPYSKDASAERFLEIQIAYAEIRRQRGFD